MERFLPKPRKISYESEALIAQLMHKPIEEVADINLMGLPAGKERVVEIKQRINQSFFRSCVMSSYGFRCCVTGVSAPELVEACHIVEWSKDEKNRLNPTNGLCLNSLFHKAYDNHLLAISPDYQIVVSERMQHCTEDDVLKKYFFE